MGIFPITEKRLFIPLILSFLLLSGSSALIYQLVWVRLLGLSIGSTAASIAIILTAFFLGLGVGSYFVSHILRKFTHPLKLYLVAEAVIGLSSLFLLPLLLHLDHLLTFLPALGGHLILKFLIVLLLLFVPTFFIGTTFPLLIAVTIRKHEEIAERVAQFYTFNTLGALLGTLLAGFVLIPRFGLDGAIYIAAGGNLSIVLIGFLLRNYLQTQIKLTEQAPTPPARTYNKVLIVLFATGFGAIATEVGWMKYLIVYTGNTIYGYSMILSIFLAGIVIGSWIVKKRMLAPFQSARGVFWGLVALGGALLLARTGLALFPSFYDQINLLELTPFISLWSKYFLMFLLLFPATFLFGALFPLSLRLYCPNIDRLHHDVGRAYGINILAGIIGSLTAGFWLIPAFGTDTLLVIMSVIVAVSASVFIVDINSILLRLIGGTLIVLIPLAGTQLPPIDYAKMVEIVMARGNPHTPGKTSRDAPRFQKEGKAGVISIHTRHGNTCQRTLLNNGIPESWFDLCDPSNLPISEYLLGAIPSLLHPDAQECFVLGYGGGTTVRAAAGNVKSIDVVELEPAVVEGVRHAYQGIAPTDTDPRVHIRFGDARNTLLSSPKRYDIILSQPSHPWLSGGANIMSRDFFEIVASRLTEQGIYGQWVNLFRIDINTLKSIIKAYTDIFPYTMSFVNFETRDLLLFGSRSPIRLDYDSIQNGMVNPEIKREFKRHGIENITDLMHYFALTGPQLVAIAGDTIPATDMNLLTEIFYSTYEEKNGNSFDTLAFLRNHCRPNVSGTLGQKY